MAGWFPQSITPHSDREQVLSRCRPSTKHEPGRAFLSAVRFVELAATAVVCCGGGARFVAIGFTSEGAATQCYIKQGRRFSADLSDYDEQNDSCGSIELHPVARVL